MFFRSAIAKEAGIDLNKMEGYFGNTPWNTIKDPIKILLNHSDCDGEISPEDCLVLAPRIRELVKSWEDDDFNKRKAIMFCEGLEEAAELNENFEFM